MKGFLPFSLGEGIGVLIRVNCEGGQGRKEGRKESGAGTRMPGLDSVSGAAVPGLLGL